MAESVIKTSSKETCTGIDDTKRSAESLEIGDDSTPQAEKKPKLGTDVAEGGDVGKGGDDTGESSEFPVDSDEELLDERLKYVLRPGPDLDERIERILKSERKCAKSFSRVVSSESDFEEDYCVNGKFDPDKWEKYCRQVKESEGFDIDFDVYPGPCVMASYVPMHFKGSPYHVRYLESLVNLALKSYNTKNNTKFKLVEMEKAVVNYFYYYLTFTALDPEGVDADAAPTTFQALVVDTFTERDIEFCRIKNKVVG